MQAVPIGKASSRPQSADHLPARQTTGVTEIVTRGTNYANAEFRFHQPWATARSDGMRGMPP